ncbi:hypothetical protein ACJU26_08225 [Acidithiobacillus sp. M4-SHS-6]|uniref:hypothetical protein n=1 Tax=Acidithiobacillus sp. M4-SHS-6 TaxID=3383024 RepID=UPI0039BE1818
MDEVFCRAGGRTPSSSPERAAEAFFRPLAKVMKQLNICGYSQQIHEAIAIAQI